MRKKMEENLVRSSVFNKKTSTSAHKIQDRSKVQVNKLVYLFFILCFKFCIELKRFLSLKKSSYAKDLKNNSPTKASQIEKLDKNGANQFLDSLNDNSDHYDIKESPKSNNSHETTNGSKPPSAAGDNKPTTVESLLFNLEQIDRQSQPLLNYDGKRHTNGKDKLMNKQ
jgi:hypothetical protein